MNASNILPWDLIIGKLKSTLTETEERQFADWIAREENHAFFKSVQQEWINIQTYCDRFHWDKEQCWNELMNRLDWGQPQTIPSPRKRIFQWKRLAAAACVAVVLGSGLFYGTRYAINAHLANKVEAYESISGKSQIRLSDGSLVRLHADASVSHNALFGRKTREVSLNGEAYFEIAPDKKRPFIVHASGMSTKVYGTKFNMASLPESDVVTVSLIEGSVAMISPKETRFLLPGETGTYNKADQSISIQTDDVAFASSWAQDRLVFKDRPLGEIVRYLSKWYHADIHMDSDIAEYTFSFTLQGEPLEEILRLMSKIHPVSYQFTRTDEVTICKRK